MTSHRRLKPYPLRAGAAVIPWLFAACVEPPPLVPLTPNFLIVLVDDVGVDGLGAYGNNPEAFPTPTLEHLASQGVLFRNAYASPVCSNTRAGLLTGTWPVQHGFGDANGMPAPQGASLRMGSVILPTALRDGTDGRYDSAMVGKWHLYDRTIPEAPAVVVDHGFGDYRGNPDNLGKRILDDGKWENQYHYWKWIDGEAALQEGTYITSDEVDDALHFTEVMSEPWLLYYAPHAAHDPWAPPPADLNPAGVTWASSSTERFQASLQALDLELGRLLDTMDPQVLQRTTVIVIGDNGTPSSVQGGPVVGLPGKGSIKEGGIHVPLIVAGAQVQSPGREVDDLVSHFDVFATVLDLARADYAPPSASVSFKTALVRANAPPARQTVYEERFKPSFVPPGEGLFWWRAARDARYKLIRYTDGADHLYDLWEDPTEEHDLAGAPLPPELEASYAVLVDAFSEVDAAVVQEWPAAE